MLVIYQLASATYSLRISRTWHHGLSPNAASALGATDDQRQSARDIARQFVGITFNGQHFQVGPFTKCALGARERLRGEGYIPEEITCLLNAAKLINRLAAA